VSFTVNVLPDFNEYKGSFYRVAIPEDVIDGTPNPSRWGAPSAVLEASDCNIGQFFANHSIIFGKSSRSVGALSSNAESLRQTSPCAVGVFTVGNVVFSICVIGDWAGNSYATSGCPGTCEQRLMDPANFQVRVIW
jgi:hypothetical protein